ncbi:MAG: flavin reductase family protein [Proteobacteria bacterium]|nr:flavin reductase family protein [Pseudomonadota bacterium]
MLEVVMGDAALSVGCASQTVGVADFKRAMRSLVSGVTIVTTGRGDSRKGLVASAVCSVSVDPPLLLVCVNKEASSHDPLLANGCFCVNVLGRSHAELVRPFSRQSAAHERFTRGRWETLVTGSPALAEAPANFDCRIRDSMSAATHTIILGEVQAIRMNAGREPLVYGFGSLGHYTPLPGEAS